MRKPPEAKAKFSLDLWCAIWFWPPEQIADCPLPNEFSKTEDGFDAIVGNPPWGIAKPNSKEFFLALDPLYLSNGKQDAIRKQSEAFGASIEVERRWLNYNAQFRALSNWVKNSGAPYGDTILLDGNGKESQDLNIGVGGGGDINLYKMFLEQAHALLGNEGRMGFIVPSGIYSDHGTGTLRTLFLDRCRWEWLAEGEVRDAQPQYAHLPIPRADIPEGVILSRDGQSYLHETEIDTDEFLDKRGDPITGPAIALPLYEGRMVGQFDFSQKGWVSGKGPSAVWREVPWENKQIEPQYLMEEWTYQNTRFEAYIDAIRSKTGRSRRIHALVDQPAKSRCIHGCDVCDQ